ncbi:MAG: hypothetical protein LBI39_04360 [Puniceicoccales bacterium]|jgi:hypothetical protein|nr:hypothetical protein [Puniceicoccales bacterium]
MGRQLGKRIVRAAEGGAHASVNSLHFLTIFRRSRPNGANAIMALRPRKNARRQLFCNFLAVALHATALALAAWTAYVSLPAMKIFSP